MYNLPREINKIEIQTFSHEICSEYIPKIKKKNSQKRDKTTC